MINNVITVFHNDNEVGKLSMNNGGDIVFQYSPSWIKNGFSISPFFLPLESRTFVFDESQELDGLCGCFYDSLPDQWGYILLKKYLKTKGVFIVLLTIKNASNKDVAVSKFGTKFKKFKILCQWA